MFTEEEYLELELVELNKGLKLNPASLVLTNAKADVVKQLEAIYQTVIDNADKQYSKCNPENDADVMYESIAIAREYKTKLKELNK